MMISALVRSSFLVCCLVFLSGRQIGSEDREYLVANYEQTFSGVGRINCGESIDPTNYSFATGTLIGNATTVFTVGHYRTVQDDGRIFDITDCKYVNYDQHGNARFSAKIRAEKRPIEPSRYIENPVYEPDWAILRLDRSVPKNIARPVTFRIGSFWDALERKNAVIIAHNGGNNRINAKRRVMSTNCEIRKRNKATKFFLHSCDTDRGSSGGLFFDMDSDGNIFAFAYTTAEFRKEAAKSLGISETPNVAQIMTLQHESIIHDKGW